MQVALGLEREGPVGCGEERRKGEKKKRGELCIGVNDQNIGNHGYIGTWILRIYHKYW